MEPDGEELEVLRICDGSLRTVRYVRTSQHLIDLFFCEYSFTHMKVF